MLWWSRSRKRYPGPFTARAYADTGPVSERIFAKHARLGWLGKNTLLLNEAYGSWLFLGVVVTSLDLPRRLGPPNLLRRTCAGIAGNVWMPVRPAR